MQLTPDSPATPEPAGTESESKAPVRVLVVEDEALVGAYIADVLNETGFQVIGIASTGREALTIARDVGADIALVDITLTGPLDGIEVAVFIRQLYGIGTIFLSGASDPEVVSRADQAQPYGFLRKPFRPGQMYNMLTQALARKAEQQQAQRPAS